nr:reverse transcriptase domain-containing protein [Tanacetum cinerariifolium]
MGFDLTKSKLCPSFCRRPHREGSGSSYGGFPYCYAGLYTHSFTLSKKHKAYVELEKKCNDALQDLDKNPLVLDMRAEIETLQRQVDRLHGEYKRLILEEKKLKTSETQLIHEVDGLRQDRVAVVVKVVPHVATKLIPGDEMGLLIVYLSKTDLFYGRCTTLEEVAALKEPFKLEKMPGYRKNHQGWVYELAQVVWAHMTTLKSSNEETSFSLTYGFEAIIPIEIIMETKRVKEFKVKLNEKWHIKDLDIFEERREIASIREAYYKQKMERIIDDDLYRKSHLSPWLQCVGPLQAKSIIQEIHQGSYEMHVESRSMVSKIPKLGIIDDDLYRKSHLSPWLQCVGPLQAKSIIQEIHQGSYEMHVESRSMVSKIPKLGYCLIIGCLASNSPLVGLTNIKPAPDPSKLEAPSVYSFHMFSDSASSSFDVGFLASDSSLSLEDVTTKKSASTFPLTELRPLNLMLFLPNSMAT